MSSECQKPHADIKTLERLVEQMKRDSDQGRGLDSGAVRSICAIIEDAIGAPINWPSRAEGCKAAELYYPGLPGLRHGFNAGVKWAVEAYSPSREISKRYG